MSTASSTRGSRARGAPRRVSHLRSLVHRSRRVDRWMFDEFVLPATSLAVSRIIFAATLLVVVLPRYLWIGSFPNAFFNPPIGLTRFFSGFPPTWVFFTLSFLITLASVFLLAGYRTRLASFGLA